VTLLWLAMAACDDGSRPTPPTAVTSPLHDTGAPLSPGTRPLHRLNRAEYDNTVRDLLGTTLRPGQDFPPDDHGHGFDNIASVLAVSPLLVELWERAAGDLAAEALWLPAQEPWDTTWLMDDPDLQFGTGDPYLDGHGFWSEGAVTWVFDVPSAGTWTFELQASGSQAGPDPVQFEVQVDGRGEAVVDVTAQLPGVELVTADVVLEAGEHTLGVAFVNDFYVENVADRNGWLGSIRLSGPAEFEPEVNPVREQILLCEPSAEDPQACIQEILEALALRAYRRPATAEQIAGLSELVQLALDEGDDLGTGVELALQALLLSPSFLFRPELDPVPESDEVRDLDAWELASRLSYFLWSSMPDDTLFELAASGELLEPQVLEDQARRMLLDPRSQALVDNFAGQWLYIRAIDNARPDPWVFADFDTTLQASMAAEMSLVFGALIAQDRDLQDLLTATDTYVDERLAQHYGIEGVDGPRWMDVSGVDRGGVLTQAGLLMALSHPDRTSPVKRGKWILEQLLCSPPADPPPDADAFAPSVDADASLRDQMAQHRADPACAACHDVMDPLGFGLDDFDGIGAWRTVDEYGFDVDSSGELPDGRSFHGATELAALLAEDPLYPECIARQGLTYALGRGLTQPGDSLLVDDIHAQFTAAGWRFSDLVVAIVQSPAFRSRGVL